MITCNHLCIESGNVIVIRKTLLIKTRELGVPQNWQAQLTLFDCGHILSRDNITLSYESSRNLVDLGAEHMWEKVS